MNTLTYEQVALVLQLSDASIKMLVQRNTLNGGGGEIADDAVLRAYVVKRGCLAAYERLKKELFEKEREAVDQLRHNTAKRLVKQCLNDHYLKFMPYFSDIYPKKSADELRRIAQSAALVERFGDIKRLRYELIRAESELITMEKVYDVLLDLGFAPYGINRLTRINLRNWFAKHKEPKSLVHKALGNDHSAKFSNNPDIIGWCLSAFISGYNPNAAHVRRMLEGRCALFNYPIPSVSWVKELRAKWEPTIAEYQWDDRNPHRQNYRVYIPTMKAPYAGTVWMIDGTQYNIVPHETASGKRARLYYVSLRDEFSGDILSVVPCYQEDVSVYLAAVKHAIEQTGYLPYEIRHDKFPGHNTEAWQSFSSSLERAGVKITQTPSAWGKARHERMYATLQSVFDSFNKLSYRDSPLSTRKHGRVKAATILKAERSAVREGFGWQQAVKELESMVSFYRHAPYSAWSDKYRNVHKSPAELHEISEKPHVKALEPWQIAQFCWERDTYTPRHGYVQFSREYQEYRYRLTPKLMYDAPCEKLSVAFNIEQPTSVHVFHPETDAYLGELVQQTDVLTAGPEAAWAELHDAKRWKQELTAYKAEKLQTALGKAADTYERVDEETGELVEIPIDEVGVLLGGIAPKQRVSASEGSVIASWQAVQSPSLKKIKKPPVADDDGGGDFYDNYKRNNL